MILRSSGLKIAEIDALTVTVDDLQPFVPDVKRLGHLAMMLQAAQAVNIKRTVWSSFSGFIDIRLDEASRLPMERGRIVCALCSAGFPWSVTMDTMNNRVPEKDANIHVEGLHLKVYTIDGMTVPKIVATAPERQTIDEIKSESHLELKRVRIERYAGLEAPMAAGWSKYLKDIKAEVIDDRQNDIEMTREVLFKTDDPFRVMLCTCKTGRLFALLVPEEIRDCEAAQNWLGGEGLVGNAPKMRIIGRS